MRRAVLIIAGDSDVRTTLERWIASAGYSVRRLESKEGAREAVAASNATAAILRVERIDLALLDLSRSLRETGCRLVALVGTVGDIRRFRRFGFVADAYLVPPLKESDVLAALESPVAQVKEDDVAREALVRTAWTQHSRWQIGRTTELTSADENGRTLQGPAL
jgi:DNA-binding response OmpR family regulator